jgi:phage terminase large subunit-like protein
MTKKPYSQRAHDYCRRVVSREVIASKWIRLAAKRHLDDLERSDNRWYYDAIKGDRVCAFIEQHPHEKGPKQGQPFLLEDWQVWIVCSIFAWVDHSGTRKHREAFLLIPRGQGKSPLAALLALWMTFFDGEKGAETLTAATTEKQAREVFGPALHFVREVPAYARLGITAAAKSIFQTRTSAKFNAVIGKAKYGSAPYCCIMDEAHQLLDSQQYDNFRTGLAKRRNSLLLTVTTAGVAAAENPAYILQTDCEKVLQGVVENDRIFAAIYTADLDVDWTSLEALQMACPNLGVSVDAESLALDQAEAVRKPARQNGFRAMHLNQWMTATAAWMNMSSWGKCYDPDLTEDSVKHLPCWIGSDLASKLDLSAVVRLYRDDSQGDRPHYYALTRTYLPEERVNAPELTHYFGWSKQGYLTSTPGSSIDYATLEADALSDIAGNQVRELAFDPRYADQWSLRLSELSDVTRVEVPPSPAVLSPAMKEVESAVADGRFHHDAHPVLTWCMSNVLTRESAAGNYSMPTKQRPESKIDAAIALFIAMARARLSEPEPSSNFAFLMV